MKTLRIALMECVTEALDSGKPQVDDIIVLARRKHGALFGQESERLLWQAARRLTKELLRGMGESEGQLPIPGLSLPVAIAVRQEDGSVRYVRADKATWPELVTGRTERERNVAAAEARLKDYDEALERLRPWMEGEPELTVEGALRREREATAA